MDISFIANELIGKITNDDSLLESFKKNAKATVKKLINVELPDDSIDAIITAVKAKVLGKSVSGIAGKLGGLFRKK